MKKFILFSTLSFIITPFSTHALGIIEQDCADGFLCKTKFDMFYESPSQIRDMLQSKKLILTVRDIYRTQANCTDVITAISEVFFLEELRLMNAYNVEIHALPRALKSLYLTGTKNVTFITSRESVPYHKVTTLSVARADLKDIDLSLFPNLQSLSLAGNSFQKIPEEVYMMPQLLHLNLSSNRLTEMSPDINQLVALQNLSLAYNDIKDLPQLPQNLLILSLEGNDFEKLPEKIQLLRGLQYLNLAENDLQTLEPRIGNMTALRHLYLDGNKLKFLPKKFDKLKGSIEFLSLKNNPLDESVWPKGMGKADLQRRFQGKIRLN